jgi:hypothetical protein
MTTTVLIPEKSESLKEKAKRWWKKSPKPDPLTVLFCSICVYQGINNGFLQEIYLYSWSNLFIRVTNNTLILGLGIALIMFMSTLISKNVLNEANFAFSSFSLYTILYLIPLSIGLFLRVGGDVLRIIAEVLPFCILYLSLWIFEKLNPKP